MRIVITIGTLGLGGAEKQAVWLANNLSKSHDVYLLTYHGGVRESDLSPNIKWKTMFKEEIITFHKTTRKPETKFYRLKHFLFSLFGIYRLKNYFRILSFPNVRSSFKNKSLVFRWAYREISNISPDLVINFLFHDTINFGLASILRLKRPYLVVGRRSPIGYGDHTRSQTLKLILRFVYRFADAAVSNSSANIESATLEGLSSNKIRIIPNFVDIKHHRTLSHKPSTPLRLICIANMFSYKNHAELIKAISITKDHEKDFYFTFVGDGPLLSNTMQLSRELKVKATFTGSVGETSELLSSSHALALVSLVEGSSNALMEGVSAGLPAICTEVGNAKELVSLGAPIILSDSPSAKDISRALSQLKQNYPNLLKQGREFMEKANKEFGEKAVLEKWIELVESINS